MPNLLHYDPNQAQSRSVPAAYAVAAAIAAAGPFLRLLDDPDKAAEHVIVGAADDPWETEGDFAATREHLDNLLCRAFVGPFQVGGVTASASELLSGCPREEWSLVVRLRRQVREAEVGGKSFASVYAAFWDCCDALPYRIVEALAPEWPELASVAADPPEVSRGAESVAQGEHMTCHYVIRFGREEG